MMETSTTEKQSLRDYQASILARLELAKQGDANIDTGYLGVVISNQPYLIFMRDVKEALPILDIHPVPLVKPWFMGMANVRGVLYAINDIGRLISGEASLQTSSSRVLLLRDEVMPHVAILVDKLIGIRKLDQMDLLQSQAKNLDSEVLGVEALTFIGDAYQDQEQNNWKILDCRQLVQSKVFVQMY